jgi:hypothetical protein
MWDGAVEKLYDTHERYWNTPQDFSLSIKWAIAGDRICTVSSILECGPSIATEKPQPSIPKAGGQFDLKKPSVNLAFADDCAPCAVSPIWPDPGINWSGRVKVEFSVDQSGTVFGVSFEGLSDARVSAQMEEQIRRWSFKPGRSDTSERRSLFIDVKCIDVTNAPAIGGCRLTPSRNPS